MAVTTIINLRLACKTGNFLSDCGDSLLLWKACVSLWLATEGNAFSEHIALEPRAFVPCDCAAVDYSAGGTAVFRDYDYSTFRKCCLWMFVCKPMCVWSMYLIFLSFWCFRLVLTRLITLQREYQMSRVKERQNTRNCCFENRISIFSIYKDTFYTILKQKKSTNKPYKQAKRNKVCCWHSRRHKVSKNATEFRILNSTGCENQAQRTVSVCISRLDVCL
jgi:hypothetical protein